MVSVPLKAMCSNMCAMPVSPLGSSTAPGVYIGMERDHRRIVPLQHNEMHAVGEREFGHALFEIFQGLRTCQNR